jgi:hypothetical protein
MSDHDRRDRKLALIYHALEFALAAVGLSWAIYQITKSRLVETKRPAR